MRREFLANKGGPTFTRRGGLCFAPSPCKRFFSSRTEHGLRIFRALSAGDITMETTRRGAAEHGGVYPSGSACGWPASESRAGVPDFKT